MKLFIENKNEITILRLQENRLDTDIAHDLKVQILATLNDKKLKLLLDLQQVQYADSTGLGAILFGVRQARNFTGILKLVNLNERVLNLIRIAKLDHVLEAYDNEQEAIDSFKE